MFVYTPLLNMFHLLVLLAISMFVCLVANKVYCILYILIMLIKTIFVVTQLFFSVFNLWKRCTGKAENRRGDYCRFERHRASLVKRWGTFWEATRDHFLRQFWNKRRRKKLFILCHLRLSFVRN